MMNQHIQLMNQCLDNDNPEAHYIEGLNQYFFQHKSIKGFNHLHQSAYLNYDNDTYLYGKLILCKCIFEEDKYFLDKLSWKNNQFKSDQC